LLLLIALVGAPVHAATCDDKSEAAARVHFIRTTLASERARLNVWAWSWGGSNAALALGQGIATPFLRDRGLRIDFIVGAASNAAGSAFALIQPLGFPDLARLEDASLENDPCRVLAVGERLLADGAAYEALSRGWLAHAGNVVFNVAVLLVLGLGFERWNSGFISAGIGLAVGITQILTQPNGLHASLQDYRAGKLGDRSDPPRLNITPLVGSNFAGLGLVLML
jgi:hypothetical protein